MTEKSLGNDSRKSGVIGKRFGHASANAGVPGKRLEATPQIRVWLENRFDVASENAEQPGKRWEDLCENWAGISGYF